MKTSLSFLSLSLALTAACKNKDASPPDPSPKVVADHAAAPSLVERGKYLVTTSGCHDCHTPMAMTPKGPAPDMTRALSGHPAALVMPPAPKLPEGPWLVTVAATNTAWSGPWGVSFTSNITPDVETGIGSWNEKMFVDTIRNGRHMGSGRPLLPPMPSAVIAQMTDADLAAMFAYLKTVPAISNRVPTPIAPPVAMAAPADH